MEQTDGRTKGQVRTLLRLEGLTLLGASLLFYMQAHASWIMFGALFLAPDLSFVAYLFGPRIGAIGYNAVHSTIGPLLLACTGQFAFAAIWLAHIGFDRALGFGLKYRDAFRHTHL